MMEPSAETGMDGGTVGGAGGAGRPDAAAGSPREQDATTRDTTIVRAAIHPGIGIARIGDSRDGWFVGPEVVEPEPQPPCFSRDGAGDLKRQAARFRVYGYNAAGEVVRELTAEDAEIRWTVHLANAKAAWYRFLMALDIPEAAGLRPPRRNAGVPVPERGALVIDPGPRSIAGIDVTGGADHAFDTGTFGTTSVDLGELRTDEAGRLLVLGGRGRSASPSGAPIFTPGDGGSFANADGWFDDIADGPVTAEVHVDGRAVPTTGAWVAVAPPNYAPDVIGWRTLYDLLVETYIEAGLLPQPATVSFRDDVLPLLRRLTGLQWVNKGFAEMFGKGAPWDFSDDALIAKLAAKPLRPGGQDVYGELRRLVLNAFRPSDTQADEPRLWPWIYGDAIDFPRRQTPRNDVALSPLQTTILTRWVAGDFESDVAPVAPPRTLAQVPLAAQPAMLDRAALHFCLADAFHPGCELTWPMRHASLYEAPFRIRHRPASAPEPDYGDVLTPEIALGPDGPLQAQGPGGLTRWMAVPWQADTVSCLSGYEDEYDPFLPTFWPARVPNHVLAQADYDIVMDASRPREERIAAYRNRQDWFRGFPRQAVPRMTEMVEVFAKLGIVETRNGIANDPDFPATMLVETKRHPPLDAPRAAGLAPAGAAPPSPGRGQIADWEPEEREAFRGAIWPRS